MNIDDMLYNDMLWFVSLLDQPLSEIREIAKKIQLADSDLDKFWCLVSKRRNERN